MDRASLYELFDVPPTCTEDELRRAYHDAILEQHPDRNPQDIETATIKTQQITSAYAQLKNLRASQSADSESVSDTTGGGLKSTVEFSFSTGIDLEDIANRKIAFRNEWEKFRQHPSDPMSALRLVHAAFRAERQDSLRGLLLNPILIDSASLLLSFVERDEACETLIKWSKILHQNQRKVEAVQILEDAFATGTTPPSVADELRRLHYSWAQYEDPRTGSKAPPEVRIEHLNRILELGFEYGYIYKFIAKAYHDLGDDEVARGYLRRAYELDPQLLGAVRISRALDFPEHAKPSSRTKKPPHKYRYSRPKQIPSFARVCEWVQSEDWDTLMDFAHPQDYSPRIVPKARDILREIAVSLGKWNSPDAIAVLVDLMSFDYYWDVSTAAMTSLSKIGDKHALRLLREHRPSNSRWDAHWKVCVSYLQARVGNLPSTRRATPQELLDRAEKAFTKENYGQACLLLENIVGDIRPSDCMYFDAATLLARCYAKIRDFRTSVELIRPLLPYLPKESSRVIYEEMRLWLWSDLAFQPYVPVNDENYQLALEIVSELALTAETADDVLKNLKFLTRWLELMGAGSIAQWVRQLIRTEAPGTRYVDAHNREQYIQNVDLSPFLRDYLTNLETRLKSRVPVKLKRVLGSTRDLEGGRLLLDDSFGSP